ncbi:uncharacterized protein LOC134274803 isoform X2 [Saccostrea cucullata]|uniref:uncharacterized protein LOC134274803 isoform X2 n=1 Tax=Saccostrea cuccullata TaxID=36930 RepID=UPI002ED27AE6
MEEEIRLFSTPSQLQLCLMSTARNILRFFGIHDYSSEDEMWEQEIVHRIQNKTFGLWNYNEITDDATKGLVQEVWTTVSEVLSEKVHMLQEAESSSTDLEQGGDWMIQLIPEENHLRFDWNQSAKSIKDASLEYTNSQPGVPSNPSSDLTNNVQGTSTVNQDNDIQVSSQESESAEDKVSLEGLEVTGSSENEIQSEVSQPATVLDQGSNVTQENDEALQPQIGGLSEQSGQEYIEKVEDIQESGNSVNGGTNRKEAPSTSVESLIENEMEEERGEGKDEDESNEEAPSSRQTISKPLKGYFKGNKVVPDGSKSVRFSTVSVIEEGGNNSGISGINPDDLKEIEALAGTKLQDTVDLPRDEEETSMTEDEATKPIQVTQSLTAEDFVYGKEAYKNYSLYVQIERKNKIKKLEESKELAMDKMAWRISKIDEIIDKAREYYQNPSGKAAEDWKELRRSIKSSSNVGLGSDTDIRYKLSKLHSHRPIFTNLIVIIQVVAFSVLCYFGGITKVGFEPSIDLAEGVPTFLGSETIHKWVKPNVWIGPNEKFWISVGALYSSCMREDYKLMLQTSKKNYTSSMVLGCCEVASRNTAGTLTEKECDQETGGVGIWLNGIPCGERPTGQNSVSHNLKPCCVNIRGECRMVSHKHCEFLEGTFHQEIGKEHCSQVNCINDLCIGKMGFMISTIPSKPETPWLSQAPQQWWRLPLSVLYHHGIVHALLVIGAQTLILKHIEVTIGWLRLIILFIVCGCGGLLNADFYTERRQKYGDVYMTHTLGRPTIRVSGANHLRVILMGENTLVSTNWPSSVKKVFGHGSLAMAEGEVHSFRKKLIIKAFTHEALENYIPSIVEITRIYIRKWTSAKEIRGYDECKELAFALAAKVLMGSDFDQEYVSYLSSTFETMIYNMFSLPLLIPGLGLWKALKAKETIQGEISKCLNKIQDEGSKQDFRSVIHHILDQKEYGNYERSEVLDALQELFFTGHDTSASAMTSVLMFVGRNPEVLERLREELDREGLLHCSDDELDHIDLNKICKLKYLYSVVREVLRVASPVGAGYRKALRTFEVGDYRIPKGWTIAIGFRDTHLTSPVYKDPETFDPSRWETLPNLERQDGDSSIDRMNYTAFGAGARFCVGKEYAKLIIRIFVIKLARNCDWKLHNPYPKMVYIPVPRAVDRLPLSIWKHDLGV